MTNRCKLALVTLGTLWLRHGVPGVLPQPSLAGCAAGRRSPFLHFSPLLPSHSQSHILAPTVERTRRMQ
jgi:hypothetical protein